MSKHNSGCEVADISASKPVSKVSYYQVVDDRVVELEVTVGHGQPGGIAVAIEGQPVFRGPQVLKRPLGPGQALRGKLLSVTAVVVDNNPLTDLTRVVFRLTGGTGVRDLSASAVADSGQAVIYSFLVNIL